MIHIQKTAGYQRTRDKFVLNNKQKGEALIKTLDLFIHNPTHPSLNLEKLKGSAIWTIRIDKGNRIFFSWITDNTALFLDIGKHDKYRKY